MTYTAIRSGEFPIGLHWTQGESRDVEFDDPPAWLVPAKADAPKVEVSPPVPPAADDGEGG